MPLAFPPSLGGDQYVSSIPLSGLGLASPPGSGAAWPTANRAIYMPVYLEQDGIVTQLWTFNGTSVAGNIDIGLYDAAGNRITSTGATGQLNTSVIQTVDITDVFLPQGWYYIGRSHSTNTGHCWRTAPAIGLMRMAGVVQQASAHPLPSSITPAALTSSYWPFCGLTYRSM